MDPNETLAKIRQAIADFNEPDTDSVEYLGAVDELIDSFKALDEWIRNGGFLPDAWRPESPQALADLLRDWVQAQVYVIAETSGSITVDYQSVVDQAKARALAFGLTWTDDYVPDHVLDNLRRAAEEEAEREER